MLWVQGVFLWRKESICHVTGPLSWPQGPSSRQLLSLPQIKRRASEALPELLRPVTPITSHEGSRAQDHSDIFSLVANLEELEVGDWEF